MWYITEERLLSGGRGNRGRGYNMGFSHCCSGTIEREWNNVKESQGKITRVITRDGPSLRQLRTHKAICNGGPFSNKADSSGAGGCTYTYSRADSRGSGRHSAAHCSAHGHAMDS